MTFVRGVKNLYNNAVKIYELNRKKGLKVSLKDRHKGGTGKIPNLEDILKDVKIVHVVSLGIVEIPLKKITGCYLRSRSNVFGPGFLPLPKLNSEFGSKWIALCDAHLEEGIRDPIKVYEYLNQFFVVEGNKRVSVLKSFDAFSVTGEVTRLIPEYDENNSEIVIYYEFLEFNRKTKINCIWFSKESSFGALEEYLEGLAFKDVEPADRFHFFTNSVYMPFREIYHRLGGGELDITTGDAFLQYVKLYGIPEGMDEKAVSSGIRKLMPEFRLLSGKKIDIRTEPGHESGRFITSTLKTILKPVKKLKIAFVYAGGIQKSNWSYAHEVGRLYAESFLKTQVSTSYVDNIPESLEAYEHFKTLAEEGFDVIFATSPAYMDASLKAALDYPGVKFFNCSETNSYEHVSTYFGRMYEPRFLMGIIAGVMTKTDIIGFAGTYPIPGVVSGINSFALGAGLVNPNARVKVVWTNSWDYNEKLEDSNNYLVRAGADVISHQNTLAHRDFGREFGLYFMSCSSGSNTCVPGEFIAAPVWNWGVFYEKIISNILELKLNPVGELLSGNQKLVNYWWGMDAGIVDITYSEKLVPRETQKLVAAMKKMISKAGYHPFTGPVYDRNGFLRVMHNKTASHEQILSMDWFVDTVDGSLAGIDSKKNGMLPHVDMLEL